MDPHPCTMSSGGGEGPASLCVHVGLLESPPRMRVSPWASAICRCSSTLADAADERPAPTCNFRTTSRFCLLVLREARVSGRVCHRGAVRASSRSGLPTSPSVRARRAHYQPTIVADGCKRLGEHTARSRFSASSQILAFSGAPGRRDCVLEIGFGIRPLGRACR